MSAIIVSPQKTVVDITGHNTVTVTQQSTATLTIQEPGPQGAQGPAGAVGATGATGATGPAGPNTVTTSTTTNITGLLKGNGATVGAASAGTDYVTPAGVAGFVPYTGAGTDLQMLGRTISAAAMLAQDFRVFEPLQGAYEYIQGRDIWAGDSNPGFTFSNDNYGTYLNLWWNVSNGYSAVIDTPSSGLLLKQTGAGYGETSLELTNDNGMNGARFRQAGTVDLIDFALNTLSSQMNLRVESRSGYTVYPTYAIDPTAFMIFGIGPGGSGGPVNSPVNFVLPHEGGCLMQGADTALDASRPVLLLQSGWDSTFGGTPATGDFLRCEAGDPWNGWNTVAQITYNGGAVFSSINAETITLAGVKPIAFPNTNFHTLTRTVPTTVGNAVNLGSFALSNGTASLEIWVGIQGGAYSQAKRYFVQCVSNGTSGAWQTVQAASSTGEYLGTQNADLEIRQSGNTAEFRLRRTLGTVAATAYVTLMQQGVGTDAFTPSTTVEAVSAPTAIYSIFADAFISRLLRGDPVGTLANFQAGSYPINSTPNLMMAASNNGGSSPAATQSALVLGRNGIAGQAFGNVVEFKTGRYENVSTNARTALDIALTHGNGDASGTNVMRLRSDGRVGIGTTSPTGLFHLYGGTTAAQGVFANVSGFFGLWCGGNTATPTTSNYSLLFDNGANTTIVNAPTGGSVACRINNNPLLSINSSRLLMGTTTSAVTATPLNFSFGGTYGNSTPGSAANLKWYLYDDGVSANAYGIGMSSGLMEMRAGSNAALAFYVNNGVEALRLATSGAAGFANLSADPSTASNGQVYYNTTTHKLRVRANGAWVDLH